MFSVSMGQSNTKRYKDKNGENEYRQARAGYLTSGTSEVRVDDFVRVWVELHKHLENEFSRGLSIPGRSVIIGEVVD